MKEILDYARNINGIVVCVEFYREDKNEMVSWECQ